MKTLEDRVVLITGASRGLGVDISAALAAHGARLALAARSADELEKVRASLEERGARAIAVPADVSDLDSLRSLVGRVEAELGPIDVLVNNAGIEAVCDFESMPFEEIEAIIRVNVVGLLWLTRLVAPSMVQRRSGHIVNIASVAGITAVPHNTVYSGSKHAVVGISRSLRAELADHGVGVSVVCPGFVEGGMFLAWGRKPPKAAGIVTPQQVAAAVTKAILKNKAEIVVNPGLGKIADVSIAAAPDLTVSMMRRMGVVEFLREQAKINAERQKG